MNYNFKDTTPHQNEPMADDNYYTDFTELDKSIEYSLTELSELIKTKGNGKAVRDIFSLAFKLIEQIDGIEDYHNEKYDEYYQKFSETLSEFNILKPEAKTAIQESKESLTKSQNALNVANGIDAKASNALSLSESADTLSKSVQEQFNQVVIDGDSSVEAAQARVDREGIVHDTLKDRIDNVTNDTTLTTSGTDLPTLGNELLATGSGHGLTLGDGWTGNIDDGFTHEPGKTANLEIRHADILKDRIFRIGIEISKPAMIDRNGVSDYYITVGGSPHFETYQGRITEQVWGIKSFGNYSGIVITPEIDFDGTLKLSVKEIIGESDVHTEFLSSDGEGGLEYRSSKKDVQSIYLGIDAGKYSLQRKDEENTALGHQALTTNTGGFWNTAIGARALRDNTVGSRNVAIGRIALAENISGDRNIAIGTFSLTRNTTGRNNIAIGADTSWYNTSGDGNVGVGLLTHGNNKAGNNNTALGTRAMQGSDGGNLNIGIGFKALEGTSGDSNIAIGDEALIRIGEGTNNVAIGAKAIRNPWHGVHNSALGSGAMELAKGVNRNTAIGANSLKNTAGSDNITLGFETMRDAASGSKNIAIGLRALFSRNATGVGDQNIAIGESALYNNEGNRNIGIGSTALSNLVTGNQNIAIGNGAGSESTSGGTNILIGYNVQKSSPDAKDEINIGNLIRGTVTTGVVEFPRLRLTGLQAYDPNEPGRLWNDNGVLKISQ